jgi:hypothetical protein
VKHISLLVVLTLLGGAVLSAACPTPQGSAAWENYANVAYSFNVGAGGPPPDALMALSWDTLGGAQADIQSAAQSWSSDNISYNLSFVQFYQASSSTPVRFYAYQVNYPGSGVDPGTGNSLDPGVAAKTSWSRISGTTIMVSATVQFFYGAVGPGGYTLLDKAAPGYDTFMVKATLHELGHTMGLNDNFFGSPLQSVMNGQSGTNDSGNSLPTFPTTCDNTSLPIH